MRYGNLSTKKAPEETRDDIRETMDKWGIEEFRIFPSRRDGVIYRDARIEYYIGDKRNELKCDRFPEYRTNLRALYLVLEQLRLAQERGILRELARAAAGLLEAPAESKARVWYEVLGVSPNADPTVIEAAYKALAKKVHPDAGGSHEAMKEVNAAIETFRNLEKQTVE